MSDTHTLYPLLFLCAAFLSACGKSEAPSAPASVPAPVSETASPPPAAELHKPDAVVAPKPEASSVKASVPTTPVAAKVISGKDKRDTAHDAPAVAVMDSAAQTPVTHPEPVAPPAPIVASVADGSAQAVTEMPELAKKNGCTACHKIDKKLIGPAWMDVSKKYKGAKEYAFSPKGSAAPDAKTYPLVEGLMMKVSKGGTGNWGTAAMIANDPTGKKQDQIKELVEFVLGLAK